jgi:hypothetical protein
MAVDAMLRVVANGLRVTVSMPLPDCYIEKASMAAAFRRPNRGAWIISQVPQKTSQLTFFLWRESPLDGKLRSAALVGAALGAF